MDFIQKDLIEFILKYLLEIISGGIIASLIGITIYFNNKKNTNTLKNKQGNNSNNIQININHMDKR